MRSSPPRRGDVGLRCFSRSVEVGPARLDVEAQLVEEVEFQVLWPRFVEVYPGYTNYLARSNRAPRMFRLRPV